MIRSLRFGLVLLLASSSACAGAQVRAVSSELPCSGELSDVARPLSSSWVPVPAGNLTRVDVVGARTVPEALIRQAIELPLGEAVDLAAVRADIRRILALAVFEDVQAFASTQAGGVVVRYAVVEQPLVRHVRVLATAEESEDESLLARLASLEGEVFVPHRLRRLRDSVLSELQRRGYQEASATVHARRVGDDAVDLCFSVDPGRLWLIERFEFVGNERLADDELAQLMATFDGRVNRAGGVYRLDFLADDYLRIKAAYYDRGMLDVAVHEPRTSWSGQGGLVVGIPIEEGPVYRVSAVSFSGAVTDAQDVYRQLLDVPTGEIFSLARVAAGLERIREHERVAGRPDMQIEPNVDTHASSSTAGLTLNFLDPNAPEGAR